MIKKILNKLFGIKFGPIEWIGDFPECPPPRKLSKEEYIDDLKHLYPHNNDEQIQKLYDALTSDYWESIPTVSGTDSYSYGSENVQKKLPKRDSNGRFCK